MSNKTQSSILTNSWLILLRLDTMLLRILHFTVNITYNGKWLHETLKRNTTRFCQTHRVHKLNFSMASWFVVRNHHSIIVLIRLLRSNRNVLYSHHASYWQTQWKDKQSGIMRHETRNVYSRKGKGKKILKMWSVQVFRQPFSCMLPRIRLINPS